MTEEVKNQVEVESTDEDINDIVEETLEEETVEEERTDSKLLDKGSDEDESEKSVDGG